MGVDTIPKEPLHLESLVFTWLTNVLDESQGCVILLMKVYKEDELWASEYTCWFCEHWEFWP